MDKYLVGVWYHGGLILLHVDEEGYIARMDADQASQVAQALAKKKTRRTVVLEVVDVFEPVVESVQVDIKTALEAEQL